MSSSKQIFSILARHKWDQLSLFDPVLECQLEIHTAVIVIHHLQTYYKQNEVIGNEVYLTYLSGLLHPSSVYRIDDIFTAALLSSVVTDKLSGTKKCPNVTQDLKKMIW